MFAHAHQVVQEAIAARQIPGAVWLVARGGRVLAREAQGYADPERSIPMTVETVFDLASLTKVTATLPAVLVLLERGQFRLDDPLVQFLPEFPAPQVRLRHLLTHTAGFPSGERLWGRGWTRAEALAHVARLAPAHPVGQKVLYSDISFQLLGLAVERLTGRRLDEAARELVFEPLGMRGATFAPGPDTAPTEYREALGRHQQGEVHDENATALEGVAGHAGLFGTVDDLLAYAAMWMGWPGPRVLSPATRATASRALVESEGERRGLGWLLRGAQYASCGDLMSLEAFGHTGFTGTSMWMDPLQDLAVILLTNRVYYGRQEHILRIRPRFHNAAVAAASRL
ncbi:MAG TPA: serine hydrolase domain-containing protein [Symbiobacteriaceae bacterium]|nr:serine hydrolase domain-containing protein [Symbiobacteriaceae bacterium]